MHSKGDRHKTGLDVKLFVLPCRGDVLHYTVNHGEIFNDLKSTYTKTITIEKHNSRRTTKERY